jgi:uncharacterized membrane protein
MAPLRQLMEAERAGLTILCGRNNMTLLNTAGVPEATHIPSIRHLARSDLDWALAEGWRDFRAKRGDILVLALIYPLMGFLAAALTFDAQLLPLFFPLVAGLSILGPAAASGFYEIARRRDAGLDSSWTHFLDPIRGRRGLSLGILTAGLMALFACWLLAAAAIASSTIGVRPLVGVADFVRAVLNTREGWTMIVIGNLVGLGFAAVTLVLSMVSFPMVVDGADAFTAVITSVRAARENPGATISWGLRVAGLLVLGALPAFIGLAVVLPVLGYATWRLYTRAVVR